MVLQLPLSNVKHTYNERVKIGENITFLLTFNFNVIIDLYDWILNVFMSYTHC